ncbi:hypothetical protein MAH1_02490 [Sessilibacter sp. MAH1]
MLILDVLILGELMLGELMLGELMLGELMLDICANSQVFLAIYPRLVEFSRDKQAEISFGLWRYEQQMSVERINGTSTRNT